MYVAFYSAYKSQNGRTQFHKNEILQILNGDVPSIVYQSPKDDMVDMYFGNVGEKYLMIPVDRVTKSLIAVRAMREKEKEIFIQEVQND